MIKTIVWLASIILIVANLFSYKSMYNMNRFSNQVDQAQNVLDSIDELKINLLELDSDADSYLITGKVGYQKKIIIVQHQIEQQFKIFANLNLKNTDNQKKIKVLFSILTKKNVLLKHLIELNKKKNLKPGIEISIIDKNKVLSVEAISLIVQMEEEKERLLHQSENKEHDNRFFTFLQASIGDILGLLLLLYAFSLLSRENKARQQIEISLRESEEKLRNSFDYATIGMAMISTDGKWLKANNSLCSMLGYTEGELALLTFQEIIHPEDIDLDLEEFQKLLSHKISNYQIEKRLFTKNEDILQTLLSISAVHNNLENPLYLIAQIQDITPRKKAEKELEYKNSELENTNNSLMEFSYIVSHDLKEPLHSIIENLQYLSKHSESKLDRDFNSMINNTVEIGIRMKTLITNLLTYSISGIHGEMHLNDCGNIIKKVTTNLQVSIKENNAIITYDSLPNIEADPIRLEQLFQNLISNALKYRNGISPRIHITSEFKDRQFIFSVRDNGKGILKENKDNIFNLFTFHGHSKTGSSTGIGLAICKKIIEYYGGKIWVESEPGQGSTFYFTIPGKVKI